MKHQAINVKGKMFAYGLCERAVIMNRRLVMGLKSDPGNAVP